MNKEEELLVKQAMFNECMARLPFAQAVDIVDNYVSRQVDEAFKGMDEDKQKEILGKIQEAQKAQEAAESVIVPG